MWIDQIRGITFYTFFIGGKIVDDCPSADPPPGCIKYVFPTEPPTVKTTAPQTTAGTSNN